MCRREWEFKDNRDPRVSVETATAIFAWIYVSVETEAARIFESLWKRWQPFCMVDYV